MTKKERVQIKQTSAREAHWPALSSPCEVITMLKELKNYKHENIVQGKTQHETPVVITTKPHKKRITPEKAKINHIQHKTSFQYIRDAYH